MPVKTPVDVQPEGEAGVSKAGVDAKEWKSRIGVCEDFHKKEFKNEVKKYYDYYQTKFFLGKQDRDRLVENVVFQTQNLLGAAIYFNNPDVVIRARTEDKEEAAALIQAEMPRVFELNNLKKNMDIIILDCGLGGVGWSKTFWNEDKKVPQSLWVSNMNVLIPKTTGGLFDMDAVPYVIHRMQRPLSEVKEKKHYKDTDKLKGEKTIRNRPNSEVEDDAADSELVTLFEVHRRDENDVFTMCQGKIIREPFQPDNLTWSHFEPLVFFPVPDKVYPLSMVRAYESLQLEKIEIRTQMQEHRRGNNRRFIATKGALDKANVSKFEANVPASLIEAKSIDLIKTLEPASTPMDTMASDAAVDRATDKTTGVTDLMRGAQSNKEQTATEARIMAGNSQVRQMKYQGIVEDYVKRLSRKQVQLMQQFFDEERSVQLPGLPGFTKYTKEQIQGEFDFSVHPFSASPIDTQTQKADVAMLTDFFMKVASTGVRVNLSPLAREMGRLFNLRNLDQILPPPMPIKPPTEPGIGPGMPPVGAGPLPTGSGAGVGPEAGPAPTSPTDMMGPEGIPSVPVPGGQVAPV